MLNVVRLGLIGALALTTFAPASAQLATLAPQKPQACPEGTFHGKCVNPLVALSGRRAAIAFTQAQISITERPYAASSDTTYSYPYNVAGAGSFVARETLIGAFGTRGRYERSQRAE